MQFEFDLDEIRKKLLIFEKSRFYNNIYPIPHGHGVPNSKINQVKKDKQRITFNFLRNIGYYYLLSS